MRRSLLVTAVALGLSAMLVTPAWAIPTDDNPHGWTGTTDQGLSMKMFVTRTEPRAIPLLVIVLHNTCDDGSEGNTSYGFGTDIPIIDGYVRFQYSHVFDFEGWFGKNSAHGWASHQTKHCATGKVHWTAAPRIRA
jgi:hypothetical protein